MKPLAIQLRTRLRNWGIQVGATTHTISLYADDTLVYVTDPESSVPLLLTLMDDFGRVSGLRINRRKTIVCPMRGVGSGCIRVATDGSGVGDGVVLVSGHAGDTLPPNYNMP
ncbi:hypothetical protein NDU88_004223 [Pleurodeles waltl]|uniref:Reverse transcriptase domain-containing protein n=1 Tax=Pleurodeles waltl TaxID=8319 RepID=A0AAV7RII5_PLEWA|nr:hypothetical protein NDU88_004223 [Pleurodeles waltl]